MATVRAKFRVNSVTQHFGPDQQISSVRVVLNPVYSSDPQSENHAFWTATPNGVVEMQINNPEAFERFVGGADYYLDFTPA